MKKLILLALAAAGIGVLVKNKSEQLKAGATKVTNDPRVQSALATASEKAAPLKDKAAPYAEAAKAKAGPYATTVKEKAGPYAATVKEKAGPYAEQAKEKAATAAGVASEKLHRNGSTTESTPASTPESSASTTEDVFDAESPATPETPGATESSTTSEYGGYPPESPAPVTGDPLTDPIDPYAEEVPSSSTEEVAAPPADPASDPGKASYDDLGEGDTVVKPTSDAAPEYAPEPVDTPKEDSDTQWFRG
ncbi:MAG: hypothetical protein ACRDPS_25855 [Nocardioides sp.]|uniref:hypothetical protein n=1 Tax=Nocardioides sp. TaxID=35761 RepID=UPI003D6B4774